MAVITHARRKSRLGSMIDAAGGISVLRALAAANANLEALKPPSLAEVARQAELLAEIVPPETSAGADEDDALNRLYIACTMMIDAAGPFDLDDVCEVARGLCDLIDAASPEHPFDWRVPKVYSTSLGMMLKLDREAPARAAVKAHLDRLIASKMA
ncbi:chemotaxis protein CheE [Brevundimonas fluminis]|jgi:hypothetical protein|uniref:chemotaxis protein CheE n=1 Tax=Brevundimonas fluminis TaxID=2487274 RepID=UPI000F65852D|nr:chemotaxis protein CheE [Brevundimonas fluminis]